MESPDVLVVGASAAGLAAARASARAGARVLVVEAKPQIGLPEPAALVAFDFLWRASVTLRDDEVRRRLDGVRIQSPAGHALEVAAPLSVLDRTKFDQRIAREAAEAGAEIRTSVRNVRVLPERRAVAEDLDVRPRVLVFADGPSTLARAFLRPVRHPESVTWGAAMRVPRVGGEKERLLSITVGAHAPGGRSQLTPLGPHAWMHWTFYRGAPSEARERARAALELDAQLRGWDVELVAQAEFLGVAPDPVVSIPHELVGDGIMVVGGAAGQGGIEMGVAAGELAGEVAASAVASGRTDARGLGSYERRWKSRYLSGYKTLRHATSRLARLSDDEIDLLVEPWAGWRVPVRDFVGLGHPDVRRRVEAASKFVARNPHAVPTVARLGVKAYWPF